LTGLYDANVFSKKWHETVTGLYSFLMRMRFQHQATVMADQLPPGNEIDPADCTDVEILMLRKAVEQIEALREKISLDFKGMSSR
jgi:signal-transduction protein with cAMP-binding, CBS, and nucleotidyltransferase domain